MGNQTELEYKFDAERVSPIELGEALVQLEPVSYQKRDTFDDVYYRRGTSIVRHRHARGGELTVKERKSHDSIMDRVEVNLCFSPKTDREDVEAFLRLTGYERMFAVRKHYVHIFEFRREDYDVEVCLYSVSSPDVAGRSSYRKFIEVEIRRRPGSDYENWRIVSALEAWRLFIQGKFHVGAPLNESLLEIYSRLVSPPDGTHYRI